MQLTFTSAVKVIRTGSHNQRAASGYTEVKWALTLLMDNEANPTGIIGVSFKVLSTELKLKLEAFNDETDQDDKWEETLDLSKAKIKFDDDKQQYISFVKNLQNGIVLQKVEIWRDEVTLQF